MIRVPCSSPIIVSVAGIVAMHTLEEASLLDAYQNR
jgi:hypothetical protein